LYNTSDEAARRAASEIENLGRKSLICKADVRSSKDVQAAVDRSVQRFGKIDILVNAAGISFWRRILDLSEEEWDLMMDVNMKGTFLCSKYVATHMVKKKVHGVIVNISSRAGKIGLEGLGHYSASKFAVLGFTQSLALELLKYGIRVNAVCPGRTETDMMRGDIVQEAKGRNIPEEEVREEMVRCIPMRRFATPQEIADAVVFLCGDQSKYIVGSSINVTGGLDLTRGGV
jgi:NAD(P)-dependent dehydrogenase (short-subunit alcohol dehydrogenase family)